MGFGDMEAFNKALLAKQLWRLITNPSSLVSQVLGARYYPHGKALDATLGPRPSYTWYSICGAKDIILAGTRWLVGNGTSIDIYGNLDGFRRWILRLRTFAVITMKPENPSVTKVGDLIDHENKAWHEELIREIFVAYDVESILSIPLSEKWPNDKLVCTIHRMGYFQ